MADDRELVGINLVPQPELMQPVEVELWDYFSREPIGYSEDGLRIEPVAGAYGRIPTSASIELSSNLEEIEGESEVTVIAEIDLGYTGPANGIGFRALQTASPALSSLSFTSREKLIELDEGVQEVAITVELRKDEPTQPLHLVIGVTANGTAYPDYITIRRVRAHYGPADDLGLFTGDSEPTETHVYEYEGDANESRSLALLQPEPEEPEPEEPEPDEGAAIENLARRVASHLGAPDDEEIVEQARAHVPTVLAFIYGYTRGKGFSATGAPDPAVGHVLISSCARLTSNPEQFSYFSALDFQARPTVFNGWTLPELAVLNQYRKRWA